jgi:hypothetical protein
MKITLEPDDRLTRQQLAKALSDHGYPTAVSTLATYATRGGGPVFQIYGRRPIYTWGASLDWAKAKLSKPVRTTSELGRKRKAISQAPAYKEQVAA